MSGSQNPQHDAAAPGLSLEQGGSLIRLNNLIWAIGFRRGEDPATTDTRILRRVIYKLSSGSQDRAAALITSPVLQEWMKSTVSLPLVVNGHMYSRGDEIRQSPLSFFCAKLVDSILPEDSSQPAGIRGIFAVGWYCGQHTDLRDHGPVLSDYDAHPRVSRFADLLPILSLLEFVSSSGNADSQMLQGMLSNMLGQLAFQLLRCPFVPRLDRLPLIEQKPPLSTLLSLFTLLVRSLPRGSTLFIVIDGISNYEDEHRRKECIEVLETLIGLARRYSGSTNDGCLVKLLVTAPLSSHHAQALFAPSETLNLPEYIDSPNGYTDSLWNMTIGELIRGIGVESA